MPENTVTTGVILEESIRDSIVELANEERRSYSTMAAILLEEALEARKELKKKLKSSA